MLFKGAEKYIDKWSNIDNEKINSESTDIIFFEKRKNPVIFV